MKPILWFTLYRLTEMGAQSRLVKISTKDLAEKLNISQQTASRHLIELEKLGLIERQITARGELVRITGKGSEEIRRVYLNLHYLSETGAPAVISIEGVVFTGLGEGAYYIGQKGYRKQIVDILGFDPYPGTLNLKLTSNIDLRTRGELDAYPAIEIKGFKDHSRTFGPAKCFRAVINDEVKGAVITAMRSHYNTSALELIAPIYLRNRLKLKDGDKVKVKIFIQK